MYEVENPAGLDQGVLLKGVYFYGDDTTGFGVVLTPRCDFAQGKADLVQVCAAYRATDFVAALLPGQWQGLRLVDAGGNRLTRADIGTGKQREFAKKLSDLQKQKLPRFHWLIAADGVGHPLVLDFQNVTSLPMGDLEPLEKVAVLRSPFREEVPARYAAYMGRVGTPDVAGEVIDREAAAVFDALFPPGV